MPIWNQCCGTGMFIPDPGSWLLPNPDPGSQIPDPNSNKREEWKKISFHTFFCSLKFYKIENYFIFGMLKKKMWVNFKEIYRTFYPIVTKLSKIRVWDPGSVIRKTYPGSRGQKGTGSRICNTVWNCVEECFPVQHPVRDDADAGVERGGGGPHPGDLQALREQAARHDHGEDRNPGTINQIFPFLQNGCPYPGWRSQKTLTHSFLWLNLYENKLPDMIMEKTGTRVQEFTHFSLSSRRK